MNMKQSIFLIIFAWLSCVSANGVSPSAPSILKDNNLPNQYIIKLKSNQNSRSLFSLETHLLQLEKKISKQKQRRSIQATNEIKHRYQSVLTGYSGTFTGEVLDWIKNHPEVEKVKPNSIATGSATQFKSPWGLTRISQREVVNKPNYEDYRYESIAGQEVDIYIIDSGVRIDHIDFEGRARFGANFINSNNTDQNGHGTHVAGIAAGRNYGVAKGANIVSVKVLDQNNVGPWDGIIAGLEFAVNDKPRWGTPTKGKVINMSIQGWRNTVVDEAVNKAVEAGNHVVVCAGNYATDACVISPAAARKAITVGATDQEDKISSFSDFGECVDIFAPGSLILSAAIYSNSDFTFNSGTSMASPHVAGIAATLLSLEPSVKAAQNITPEVLTKRITELATKNVINHLPGGTVNLLAFSNPPSYSNNKY